MVKHVVLQTLNEKECRQLLATEWLGRVGITVRALPEILPVAYAMDGVSVVFRTSAESKLRGAAGQIVCFEVDHTDRRSHQGWSVLMVGWAREVTDAHDVARLDKLHIERWASPDADHYIELRAGRLSGRRFERPTGHSL